MNRLQKKCLIAAAGTHFLLVVVLLCSGFIKSKPKLDDSQVLDVIPAKAVDAAMQSGVRNTQQQPPTPPTPPEPPQPPTPAPPTPEVKHVEPPKPVEHVKPPEPIEPEVTKPEEPAPAKPKPPKHVIDVSLTPVVPKKTTEPDHSEADARAAEKAAKKAHDAKVRAMQRVLNTIKESTSSATTVELKGDSTVAYANYASIVKSVYTRKWILPDNAANDEANVKVSVTIARDGRVIEAHIVERSGDSSLDSSVQRTLERVQEIAPFPDDATDKERTYIIYFDLKAKRMLG